VRLKLNGCPKNRLNQGGFTQCPLFWFKVVYVVYSVCILTVTRDIIANLMIRPERISERLYSDLLNSILIGDYPAHGKLPTEMILARDYGISRTTVRVALTQLKKEGFIVSRQGAGTVVSDFENGKAVPFASNENLIDLEKCFECRLLFEPEIVAIVSKRCTPEDEAYFQNHLKSLKQLVESNGLYTSEDTGFHLSLASLSGNKFFESIMTFLRPHILFGMNVIKTIPKNARENHAHQSLKEHTKIVEALIEHDAEKARQAMYYHLEKSRCRIFEEI